MEGNVEVGQGHLWWSNANLQATQLLKGQPLMATLATKENTCHQVLIGGKCIQVPNSPHKNASSQLEHDQQFRLTLHLKLICDRLVSGTPILVQSPNRPIRSLISSTNVHSATTCRGCTFGRLFAFLYFLRPFGIKSTASRRGVGTPFSDPLLASLLGKKKVKSSDEEVDLFAAPPVAPSLASSGALPQGNTGKGKKASLGAPFMTPIARRRYTCSTILSETAPSVEGDWPTDKDISCS